jgi:NitT/TauT family transport system permease protein
VRPAAGWVRPIVVTVLILVAWEWTVRASEVTSLILPRPSEVGRAMVDQASLYFRHALTTAIEVVAGFVMAIAIGGFCGALVASSAWLGSTLYPLLVAAQVMPKVAIAPLLVVWLGFDLAPKLVLTALIAFFPIVVNTVVGLNMTRRDSLHLFRSMGATPWQTFWKLRLPNALPVFFAGLKVAATLAVIGAVVGEFSGGSAGLGYLLLVQVGRLETAAAFGSVMGLTLMGLALFCLVVALEHAIVPAHMLRRFEDPAVRV